MISTNKNQNWVDIHLGLSYFNGFDYHVYAVKNSAFLHKIFPMLKISLLKIS